MLSILEDLESQEAMVAFFNFAGAHAQEEQRLCCQRLAQQVSSQKPEAAAPAPGTGGEFVCAETHRGPQGAMEKVQSDFMEGEGGPEGEGGETRALIHPPLGTDRYHEKVHHPMWEPGGSVKDVALAPGGGHHQAGPGPGDEGLCEVSLTDSVEPAPGEAREGSPSDHPTAQQIMQLLSVMRDTQEHPGLASNPCVPFFSGSREQGDKHHHHLRAGQKIKKKKKVEKKS
ncbi:PREDICTED: golgin subfamily A member 2-like [Rhinopithecus bieti]|uniref:golgin subfamily A member 2-like n=1 Tax=Rhinopithecus bieti TaxID=61621 RepID=UPI00083C1EAD|nr:PREDICTED: golgin subfamily A member 2-like [Rhinopithecus bieti]